MSSRRRITILIALLISSIVSACGTDQPFDSSPASSTSTISPALTFTPTAAMTVRSSLSTKPASAIALVNGILIDGTGSDPVPDAVVVIRDSQIVDVGRRRQVEIPEDAQIIDVKGGTILPGLIDAHVHLAYSNAARWAQAGITTVRSLGEGRWSSVCQRKDVKGEKARVVSAGPIITVPKGYPIWFVGNSDGALAVVSPEAARKWTGILLGPKMCEDVIKVALDGGPQLSDEELQVIAAVAHERGTIVSAHVTSVQDLKKALANGVDDMAHMVRDPLPQYVITQMIGKNVYVVPTLKIFTFLGLPGSNQENLGRFVAAGGQVAVGTDYNDPNFPQDMYLQEMKAMQEAGMTPMQVLVAATKNGAHVSNLEDTIGTLEPGKIADVLVVKGNPLEDLDALADVQLVMHGGVVIRNDLP